MKEFLIFFWRVRLELKGEDHNLSVSQRWAPALFAAPKIDNRLFHLKILTFTQISGINQIRHLILKYLYVI